MDENGVLLFFIAMHILGVTFRSCAKVIRCQCIRNEFVAMAEKYAKIAEMIVSISEQYPKRPTFLL